MRLPERQGYVPPLMLVLLPRWPFGPIILLPERRGGCGRRMCMRLLLLVAPIAGQMLRLLPLLDVGTELDTTTDLLLSLSPHLLLLPLLLLCMGLVHLLPEGHRRPCRRLLLVLLVLRRLDPMALLKVPPHLCSELVVDVRPDVDHERSQSKKLWSVTHAQHLTRQPGGGGVY